MLPAIMILFMLACAIAAERQREWQSEGGTYDLSNVNDTYVNIKGTSCKCLGVPRSTAMRCEHCGLECVDFTNIDPQLQRLTMINHKLEYQVLDLTQLPEGLQFLNLSRNKLTLYNTTLDLTRLPSTLQHLDLGGNKFDETFVDLTKLPAGLRSLNLYNGYEGGLKGTLDMAALPPQLEELILRGNLFSGPVNLSAAPKTLRILNLEWNQFTAMDGTQWNELPPRLEFMDLSDNKFHGDVQFTSLPSTLQFLDLSSNEFAGALDLTRLPPLMQTLDLTENNFKGTPDLSSLPPTLGQLYLRKNQLRGCVEFYDLPQESELSLDLANNCGLSGVIPKRFPPRKYTVSRSGTAITIATKPTTANSSCEDPPPATICAGDLPSSSTRSAIHIGVVVLCVTFFSCML